ncbi:MAG: AAA family ATPase [Chloroflexaceae bacterium]|nr:AAA family ATPase [Chloroflexaceae bacterium]
MLTRLKVSGFKNLVDVDVRFGPFTCIAGANGVGKSNLFDAIRFLSALADRPLIEAALSVRDESGRTGDVRSLFHRIGNTYANSMSFEAEMIIPAEGIDDLGQQAQATITFVRYTLELEYRHEDNLRMAGALEITKEELVHINLVDAHNHLLFRHKLDWRKTAVKGKGRRGSPFISTEKKAEGAIIRLHQDGGTSGRPRDLPAANLPRTVLSATNAAESPTALLTRREMQSWQLLQLEPSALRKPDEFTASPRLGSDGSHLAATLYYLARLRQASPQKGSPDEAIMTRMYGQVANRLSELIDDVQSVWVERDERRELLTLFVQARDGTAHPARALSDGTLRFLALSVIELDPETKGLLCFEEPENGIHPERIPAMLKLLQDIAVDPTLETDVDNPLRQVIINTHSPAVVAQVPDDSLLVAELKETVHHRNRFKRLAFTCLPDTWREHEGDSAPVSKGKLLAYLNPYDTDQMREENISAQQPPASGRRRRVMDRPDLQMLLKDYQIG